MSIKATPGKGIDITLDMYSNQLVTQGGADFWSFSNQQLLTRKLAPFLPHMEYGPDNKTVHASMIRNGRELLGDSRPIPTNPVAIPAGSLEKLQQAIDNLKEEAQERNTDASVRELINAFSLPNPRDTPELYRLIGSESNPQLIVLWGLEKRNCVNIPITRLQLRDYFKPMARPIFTKRNMIIGGAILFLLLLCLIIKGCSGGDDEAAQTSATTAGVPITQGAPGTQGVPGTQGAPGTQGVPGSQGVPGQSSPLSSEYLQASASFGLFVKTTQEENNLYFVELQPMVGGQQVTGGAVIFLDRDNYRSEFAGTACQFRIQPGIYRIMLEVTTANTKMVQPFNITVPAKSK